MGSIHDDNLQGGAEFGISRKSKRVKIMEDGDGGEELEGRPPYLHVCCTLAVSFGLSVRLSFPGPGGGRRMRRKNRNFQRC